MSNMPKYYRFIRAANLDELQEKVNKEIRKGERWYVEGAPFIEGGYGTVYVQVLCRQYRKPGSGRPKKVVEEK